MNDLELLTGEISGIEARVYARLPRPGAAADWRLCGEIRGPYCEFARTLPAPASLRPLEGAATLLAEAVLPDPCCWTPELPFLYTARVELRRGEQVIDVCERPLAIRPLGPHGTDLFYGGRRWVLRGVARDNCPQDPVEAWREAGAAMLVADPDDALAEAAARLGVPLLVTIGATAAPQVAAELRRLARWPAVAIVAIDAGASLGREIRQAAPNILLAAHSRSAGLPTSVSTWAHVVLCATHHAPEIARCSVEGGLPAIGFRPLGGAADVAMARAACDALQRDLAPHADLAGYIV